MNRQLTPDYLDSLELLRHSMKVESQMQDILFRGLYESREMETEAINKLVFDAAKESGVSVYDICLHTYPDVEYSYPGVSQGEVSVNAVVTLRPIVLNLGQGPGYWKKKYFQLKEKMQKLIDEKEDL